MSILLKNDHDTHNTRLAAAAMIRTMISSSSALAETLQRGTNYFDLDNPTKEMSREERAKRQMSRDKLLVEQLAEAKKAAEALAALLAGLS